MKLTPMTIITAFVVVILVCSAMIIIENDSDDSVSLTYHSNVNDGSDNDPRYPIGFEVVVKEPMFLHPYAKFVSWNTSSDGTGLSYSPGDSFIIEANTNLYAQWELITAENIEEGLTFDFRLDQDTYYYYDSISQQTSWVRASASMTYEVLHLVDGTDRPCFDFDSSYSTDSGSISSVGRNLYLDELVNNTNRTFNIDIGFGQISVYTVTMDYGLAWRQGGTTTYYIGEDTGMIYRIDTEQRIMNSMNGESILNYTLLLSSVEY